MGNDGGAHAAADLMNGALWRQFIGCWRILILSLPWEIRGFNPWNEPFDAGPGRAGRNARRSPGPGGSFGLACNFVRGASALICTAVSLLQSGERS